MNNRRKWITKINKVQLIKFSKESFYDKRFFFIGIKVDLLYIKPNNNNSSTYLKYYSRSSLCF